MEITISASRCDSLIIFGTGIRSIVSKGYCLDSSANSWAKNAVPKPSGVPIRTCPCKGKLGFSICKKACSICSTRGTNAKPSIVSS